MKKSEIILLSSIALISILLGSGFIKNNNASISVEPVSIKNEEHKQTVNLFVTHGHCSTPFAGAVENLKVKTLQRKDQGNPLEGMDISFEINPNTFKVCRGGDDLTERIKTKGLFIGYYNQNITFKSTNVYTMGLDWYQVNGKLAIKGVEKDVKFFVSGIRALNESNPTSLVLEGQMNLHDWGIDYDKIVNGKSDAIPTKWMHINMKIELPTTLNI